ncbi:efflux RND transporter periplasmic adaptor subunit [Nostoc parmelioides]|uniref:Efflux RND transporter periplasmic adaptor subunit n=1 Tax=Nostoc parmelioides FACHB-3921 TaxID=2692909 RepID=A0ABR8BKI4_9NOSO|nr:efflux RND transporter periplasmic adaptor subunit [Nostoc parmelioides]MBD2254010.1 efflux RND transporter periplasmic adaptor subunit [Nostoc parmelioides FACHB-3921]
MKQQTYPATSQLIKTKLQFSSGISTHRQIFPGWQCAKHALFAACLLSIGVLTASCGSLPKETAEAQSQQRRGGERGGLAPVDVAIARRERLETQPEYTGTTTPFRTISLRSQVEARLLALNLDVGDTVKRGQNVGQLDDIILSTDLKQAEAELAALESEVARATTQVSNARAQVERARLEVVQAEADAQRQERLFKEGAISEQAAEQARTEAKTATQALRAATEQVRTEEQAVAAAKGRVFAQKAVVAQTKERRSYTRLTSPLNGVITERVTEPGNLLQAGGEVLKIADLSRIKVVVQVSELELGQIQVGQSVQVRLDAFPDQTIIGRVARISPTADATARLIPVEVVIPNSQGNIGSGLLARVNFASQTPERVVVSQTAIQREGRNQESSPTTPRQSQNQNGTLYVVTDSQGKPTVTARTVTLGKSADGKVEILSGLQPGEQYVARSGRPLKDGENVRLSILSERNPARN